MMWAKRPEEIIARSTLFWLLLTHFALVIPLADKTTPWSLGISAICLVWRLGIFFGKVARPPRWLVTALGIASAITLALVGSQIGLLNALMNLLILGYSLKTIEIIDKRDVRTVILVGYFLIALNLIDSQGIGAASLALALVWLNTQALLSLYLGRSKSDYLSFKLVAQSLPLALLLFLVLPRLPPLWMVPSLKSATTGLSDEVGFGDISKLTRSDALAFRVKFDGQPPANPELYWRALVLEDYDGKHWRQDDGIKLWEREAYMLGNSRDKPAAAQALSYEVIAEPSGQRWLFGLDVAFSASSGVFNLPDYRLLAQRKLDGRFQYRAEAYRIPMDASLSEPVRRLNLSLPPNSNPRTRELARAIWQQYPSADAFLNQVMHRFSEEAYFYTLSPPPVGSAQIDDFLFDNKQGFCVHYASALTFLARAAGIPARMVTGYQGGEFNPNGGYVSVYQYMAHAWSEVWLDGKGWVRLDPTAMIAPSRILDGFDAAFNSDESYLADNLFSPHRVKEIPWLNELRMRLASIDYYWSVWVLGFDNERREGMLNQLLGSVNRSRLIAFVISVAALILLLLAWQAGILRLPPKRPAPIKGFLLVERALTDIALPRAPGEGPIDYSQRAAMALPGMQTAINHWIGRFTALRYQNTGHNKDHGKSAEKQFVRQSRRLARAIRKQGTLTQSP